MKTQTGLGYRAPFYDDLIQGHSDIGWLEIITENYLWDKGARRQTLTRLKDHYELAFHGVSLSLASPEEHDLVYLKELSDFCKNFKPIRVSDHLCWSSLGNHNSYDLLPFPYTEENLHKIERKVFLWQDFLERPLVLENLSAYITSTDSTMSEYEFLGQLCKSTGCQILLDVNNMIVNSRNFCLNPYEELKHIDLSAVAQVHLAGFVEGKHFVIDTHSTPPHPATWELWEHICKQRNDIPFMVEWDQDIPEFFEVKKVLDQAGIIARGAK